MRERMDEDTMMTMHTDITEWKDDDDVGRPKEACTADGKCRTRLELRRERRGRCGGGGNRK